MQTIARKNIFASLCLGTAVFFIVSTLVSSSLAQNLTSSQTLEVSPPSQEVKVDPGQTVTFQAKVRNKNTTSLQINVRVEDFTASGEAGQVALTEKGPYSIVSWTSLEPSAFTLKAGETKEVTATMEVPLGYAGGRYGSFVFSVGGGTSAPGTASVSQEVASLFLVRISGPITEQLSVSRFQAPKFLEFGPVPMTLTFKNTGNVHVRPTGLINVRDIFGKTTADVVFRGENVLPGASRELSAALEKRWLFGPYTAQAVLTFGSKNESITATTSFFVLPVRIIAGCLILLGALYMMRKRLSKAIKALVGK